MRYAVGTDVTTVYENATEVTATFSEMSPAVFKLLVATLNVAKLVAGEDYKLETYHKFNEVLVGDTNQW